MPQNKKVYVRPTLREEALLAEVTLTSGAPVPLDPGLDN